MNRRQKLIQQQFLNNEKGIISRLGQVYAQALKDINGNIERLMKRFDPDTGDLDQSAIYQLKYQNMVKDQLEGILNELQTKQFVSVAEYLDTCYEDGFVGSLFDLHGQGVPLMMPLDQEAMVTAVQLDSKISKGLYTRLGEDVTMLKKRITAEVSRSIATGVSFAVTAKQLAGKTRIGYNNAIRIARTEGHRIQNQATMNVMEQAKDRGADVVKQWDATLDGKTRDSHVAVDGEIREVDERFSNGLKFPGDPSGSAAEVINCRCQLMQRARWAVGGSFTKWNNFTKQLETFDSPEAYDEFKKAFFSGENKRYMNYVQDLEKKYHTKDWGKILDGMNTQEYNHYSTLLKNNPVYNKVKGGNPVGDVTDTFNRKMSLMSYEEDLVAVNPNWSTNKYRWTHNCQRCVSTYEMRRRGYDVTAKPLPGKLHDDYLAHFAGAAWQGAYPEPCPVGSGKNQIEVFMGQWGDGARAIVNVRWPGGAGHVFIAEQRNGKTIYLDPQTGETNVADYFKHAAKGGTWLCRIDHLLPNEHILDCCE